MKRILAGACALGLIACSPQGEPAAKTDAKPEAAKPAEAAAADAAEVFTYVCPAGKTFSVSYDEGFTTATVKSGADTYKLPAVISGSGTRYSDGKVEFWEHQGEAMLNGTPGGDSGSCPRKEEPK
ncbi:MAG TPA: MliC family protein [Hyphomonadaceae bacterium]|nr:MliC family protein [Hyphomonadaceae bacterium]